MQNPLCSFPPSLAKITTCKSSRHLTEEGSTCAETPNQKFSSPLSYQTYNMYIVA